MDHIPRAVKGTVEKILSGKDEKKVKNQVVIDLGIYE